MSEQVMIIGAGGHGRVIADIIKKSGDTVVGFLDNDTQKPGVLGSVSDCFKYPDKKFVIAIGNNGIRKKLAMEYPDLSYYTAVHPAAVIGENVTVGKGTVIMANAVINPGTQVGEHCILNTASVTEHDCRLSDFVHLSPGAVLCGTVTVGEGCHIGANAVVRNNISIEKDIVVGCGGAVVKNLEQPGVYIGVPAKRIEK